MSKPKGTLTVAEAGARGGKKTAETHGHEFYEEIGRKGGAKVREACKKMKEEMARLREENKRLKQGV